MPVMDTEAFKTKSASLFVGVKTVLSSDYFPFISAAVSLLCYYLGWDIVSMWYISAVGTLMILLLDDLTPFIPHSLFTAVVVSVKNSPSPLLSDGSYYRSPVIIALILVAAVPLVTAALYRIIKSRKNIKFNAMTVGLLIFDGVLILNGLSAVNGYDITSLFYGFTLAFVFTVPYLLVSANSTCSEENYKKIGWGFMAFSLLLIVELAIKYFANWDSVFFEDGSLNKETLLFGWGIWNTMGMFLVICIPPVFLLAAKSKYGYPFILYATVIAAAAVFTGSRQAMMGTAFSYVASVIACLVTSKDKRLNIAVLIAIALIAAIVAIAVWDKIINVFSHILDNLFNEDGFYGNHRVMLFRQAWNSFLDAPFFGQGFYIEFLDDPGFAGLEGFIPKMAHNTFMELLATCGAFGLLGYLIHRAITVICFIKKPSGCRTFIALSVLTMLILCQFDNHIFYLFPTFVYSALLTYSTDKSVEFKLPLRLKREKK